jgi:N-acetylglucosamine kinase-like BadF-type ATPase
MDKSIVTGLVHKVIGDVPVAFVSESDMAMTVHAIDVGVSIVAGTGSSCRSIDEKGKTAYSGGFGPQFGDEGSGYWIARQAIVSVARAEDGRAPATDLRERLFAHFEILRLTDILRECNANGHVSVPRIAAFAPVVMECARGGDEAARGICRAAGRELGRLVIAACSRVHIRRRPVPVAPTGGVFNGGPLVLGSMRSILRASGIEYDVRSPVFEPARGLIAWMVKRRNNAPADRLAFPGREV